MTDIFSSSDREWAIFCTEEMESSERKFQDLECRKNAQIQSLSAENAKLQRAIEISKKNRYFQAHFKSFLHISTILILEIY